MALERFIPKSPDINIRNGQDFEVAKFGHLNTIVEYINNNSAKPAGLNGYVQFNDNAALGGSPNLVWNNSTNSLNIGSNAQSYLSFTYNPSNGSTYVGGINVYQDGVNLFPIMDFTRFGDTVFRRQQRAIFIYYTNENNGINYTNGQLVSQIETTGVRNGIVGSTLFRESVIYNGDGITRRGRYSHGVAQQSSFGGFQYVATQYGNLKINIIGDNASGYIDDAISATTAYNMHASNIINTTSNGSLPILSLDYNGLTKHVFQINGNVSFNNTADMAAIVGIKGSGSTSATTALLVQNSTGTNSFEVKDDRNAILSGGLTTTGILSFADVSIQAGLKVLTTAGIGGYNAAKDGTKVDIYGSQTTASSFGGAQSLWINNTLLANNNNYNLIGLRINPTFDHSTFVNTVDYGIQFNSTFAFSTGTNNSTNFILNPTYNYTGGTNTVRGIYYNPTLTSLVNTTHRAIETTTGDVLLATTSGNVGIGTTSPTKKLDVVGAAADGIIRVAGPYSDIQLINKNSAYNVGDWKPAIRFLENGVFTADIAYAGGFFEFGSGLKASTIYTTGSSNSLGITNSDVTVDIGGRSQLITFTDYNYGLIRGGINLPYVASPSGYGMNIYVNSGAMTFTTGGSTRLSIAQAGGVTITGGGSTSGTTSLLVQNSLSTALLTVRDDGFVRSGGDLTAGGTMTLEAGGTVKSAWGQLKLDSAGEVRILKKTIIGSDVAVDNSAILELRSTTQGFLPPRMTTLQRTSIASPTNGLIVFDTDVQNLCYRRDGVWVQATFAAV